MPIVIVLFLLEILFYSLWISTLGLSTFVFIFLFQTFFGFLLLSSAKNIYYKSIAVFHILPSITLRMLGLILLVPFHLILGKHLKQKMNQQFQSGFQNQRHFQFIFRNYGTNANDFRTTSFRQNVEDVQFNGQNFEELKDVTPTQPKMLDTEKS